MLDLDRIETLSKERFVMTGAKLTVILNKASSLQGISIEEAARLLAVDDPAMRKAIYIAALAVKQKVFGDRIVLFAPLYLSNECANRCLYCGFQAGNAEEKRKTLSVDEAVKEARFLTGRGFRRTLLVSAENKAKCGIEYIASVAKALYERTDLRIIHLNAAPMEIAELKTIRDAGIAVFQVFQETYHRPTYEKLHVAGSKKDFEYRLTCMNRALDAGFKDLGIGALLGLYDHRYDVLATIAHAQFLKNEYGTYPHTISVPRFRPAKGAAVQGSLCPVDDDTFKHIVAVYRLAVPTAGIVVSTREPALVRDEILLYGASQISAESSTTPGGYTGMLKKEEGAQFSLSDERSLEEVVLAVLDKGMFPSFCTACYKRGREGDRFHELAASGKIKDLCEQNAYSSFLEYLEGRPDGAFKRTLREKLRKYNISADTRAGVLA